MEGTHLLVLIVDQRVLVSGGSYPPALGSPVFGILDELVPELKRQAKSLHWRICRSEPDGLASVGRDRMDSSSRVAALADD